MQIGARGDLDDRKSTSGYLFQIGGGAVSWRSKKQTAEAEYVALASTAQEALWLKHLLTDLSTEPLGPMVIYEDNQSAIAMTKSQQFHGRSKHISIMQVPLHPRCGDGWNSRSEVLSNTRDDSGYADERTTHSSSCVT